MDNCPICLDTPQVPRVLGCGHGGCVVCFAGWVRTHNKCPVCRAPVATSVPFFMGAGQGTERTPEQQAAIDFFERGVRFSVARPAPETTIPQRLVVTPTTTFDEVISGNQAFWYIPLNIVRYFRFHPDDLPTRVSQIPIIHLTPHLVQMALDARISPPFAWTREDVFLSALTPEVFHAHRSAFDRSLIAAILKSKDVRFLAPDLAADAELMKLVCVDHPAWIGRCPVEKQKEMALGVLSRTSVITKSQGKQRDAIWRELPSALKSDPEICAAAGREPCGCKKYARHHSRCPTHA